MASAYDTMNKDVAKKKSAAGGMGIGNPKLTVQKRNEYGMVAAEFQLDGAKAPSWPEWLDEQGYGLDESGNVFEKN